MQPGGQLNYTAMFATLNRALTVSGTANFQSGLLGLGTSANLNLAGGGTIQGTSISVAANASLTLSGNGTLANSQIFELGASTVHVNGGGTWTVAGQATIQGNFAVDQATINVSGRLQGQLSLNLSNGSSFNIMANGQFATANGSVTGSGMVHIMANGTWNTLGPYNFDAGVNVQNDGTIMVQGGVSLTVTNLLNIGNLQLSANGTGRFSNIDDQGQVTASGQAQLLFQGGSISGGLQLQDQVHLYMNGTHATGTSQFTATPQASLFINASFAPDGTPTVFDAGSMVNLQGAVQVAGGEVDFLGSAFAGSFDNAAGNVQIGPMGNLVVGGNYVQDAGMTIFNGGTLTATTVQISGGAFVGAMTIVGDVVNNGEIDVGGGVVIAVLNITGNYTQTSTGILNIAIGGYGPGVGYDQLAITGTAVLDGTLNVILVNGFVPQSGDAFQILTASEVDGMFAMVNADPAFLPPIYDPADVTMQAQ